ncbi:hypothetical protein EYF80_012253 [Liparis tanakae]|uniref:Uncharacterized protein n=1 Tax=Liparis tanakae TaxID=230148 RepID=A0A4Z2IHF0_9TELE|nr:hypothetical protein EYF80_012253 [Liparis tanakae]
MRTIRPQPKSQKPEGFLPQKSAALSVGRSDQRAPDQVVEWLRVVLETDSIKLHLTGLRVFRCDRSVGLCAVTDDCCLARGLIVALPLACIVALYAGAHRSSGGAEGGSFSGGAEGGNRHVNGFINTEETASLTPSEPRWKEEHSLVRVRVHIKFILQGEQHNVCDS